MIRREAQRFLSGSCLKMKVRKPTLVWQRVSLRRMDPTARADGYYCPADQTIGISPHHTLRSMLLTLAHEIGHHIARERGMVTAGTSHDQEEFIAWDIAQELLPFDISKDRKRWTKQLMYVPAQ